MRVLIVEDEPRLAENIARSLRESAGYAVDVAADGQEGLFLAESNTYDVVLLDLMLPQMDPSGRSGHARAGADRARRKRICGGPTQCRS